MNNLWKCSLEITFIFIFIFSSQNFAQGILFDKGSSGFVFYAGHSQTDDVKIKAFSADIVSKKKLSVGFTYGKADYKNRFEDLGLSSNILTPHIELALKRQDEDTPLNIFFTASYSKSLFDFEKTYYYDEQTETGYDNLEMSGWAYSAGLSFSYVATPAQHHQFIPALDIAYTTTQLELSSEGNSPSAEEDRIFSFTPNVILLIKFTPRIGIFINPGFVITKDYSNFAIVGGLALPMSR